MSKEPTGTIISADGGKVLVIERTFNAPINDVWDSIVQPERMNRWIGTWSGNPGNGKHVSFTMTAEGMTEGSDVLIHKCQAPHVLEVETTESGGTWHLRADLTESVGVTTLVFRHYLKPGDDAGSIGPGWEYYLDRLMASREGAGFAEWDAYYPAQKKHWEEADRQSRSAS